ncbi:MAG: hypothetical protein CTY16_11235 [Methylobacter sp.]|nr:MAG: hypothetical protein CTY16_11235 [Methylobacter sp.]
MRHFNLTSRWLLVMLFVFASQYAYGDFGEFSNVATDLGFRPEDHSKLLAGDIITADLPETTDKMLAQAFAVFAPIHTHKVADLALSKHVFAADANVIASGRIDPNKIAESLTKATFTSAEANEAKQLKNFSGGEAFNLSTEEIAKIKKAVTSGKTSTKALSKVYRAILAGRMEAYLKSGIQGIAPFDRGNGINTRAANDFDAMTKASTILAKDLPGLYRTFLEYPNNQSAYIEHAFFWVKRRVENRPAFVLEHRILERSPASMILLRREFFVGHSYNGTQAISGAFTISQQGTLIFTTIRTSSDQVAGLMGGASLGRKMLRDEVTKRFKNLREHFVTGHKQ